MSRAADPHSPGHKRRGDEVHDESRMHVLTNYYEVGNKKSNKSNEMYLPDTRQGGQESGCLEDCGDPRATGPVLSGLMHRVRSITSATNDNCGNQVSRGYK